MNTVLCAGDVNLGDVNVTKIMIVDEMFWFNVSSKE
jgi:hypothetical protein